MIAFVRHLFVLLVLLSISVDLANAQQTPGCAACTCNITGAPTNLAAAIVEPAIGGTSAPVVIPVGMASQDFQTTGNRRYRIRLCGSAIPQNTVMHIRRVAVVNTVIPNACDDDGCGVTGGLSQVEFVAAAVGGLHRAFVYMGACNGTANLTSAVTITVENLGPDPAPANDNPTCGVSSWTLPLPTICSNSIPGTTLGATATIVNGLNAFPRLPTSAAAGSCATASYQHNWLGATHRDVWFQVPVPPSGMLGLSTSEGSLCAGGFTLYKNVGGSCVTPDYQFIGSISASGNSCSNQGLVTPNSPPEMVADLCAAGLSPGDFVYIRYWERADDENGNFQICAYEPTRPSNDQPCGATVLDVSGTACVPVNDANNNATATTGVTVSAPTCGIPTAPLVISNDQWFQFTVPAFPNNNITVTTFSGTLTDMAMAWYRLTPSGANLCPTAATCPPGYTGTPTLTQITTPVNICSDDIGANTMPSINNQTLGLVLTPGEVIYVRVWSKTSYYGTYSICARRNIPPVNDNPCGAIPLPVASDCELVLATNENATNTGAIQTPSFVNGAASCVAAPYTNDVWFYTVVPGDLAAPYGVEVTANPGAVTDAAMAIYRRTSGSCAAGNRNLQQIAGACALGGHPTTPAMPRVTVTVPTVSPGDTLWVRVWRSAGADGTFTMCARRTDPLLCEGSVFDPGGPSSDYANNLNWTQTYCASKDGDVVTLDFQSFQTEPGFDVLTIFNGPTVAFPIIGTYTGTVNPGVITGTYSATNPRGCLTLRFTTDVSVVAPGWVAKMYCSPPPPPPPPALGVCNTTISDPGGPTAPYANNIGQAGNPPFVQTYCPYNGNGVQDSVVTLNFTTFAVENFFDGLFVFTGSTPNAANLISSGNGFNSVENNNPAPALFPGWPSGGSYWGTGVPGPFSGVLSGPAPQGCLTVMFVSDISVTPAGWLAQVTCGPPPPPPPPSVIGGTPGPTAPVTTACGSFYLDDGVGGNYANFGDYQRTICPPAAPPNQTVTMTFLNFDVENGFAAGTCFDMLYVYDGPNVASPLISSGQTALIWPPLPNPYGNGGFCGTTVPGPFTSSHASGCLTYRFFSDDIVTRAGWRARIDCAVRPPNDDPCSAFTVNPANRLLVNSTCSPTSHSNAASSPTSTTIVPVPVCSNYTGADVWFTFLAPANGRVFIDATPGTMQDGAMQLYSGSCPGSLVPVECDDDDGINLMPQIDRLCNPLVGGQVYWLRFWGVNGEIGTFNLCLTTTNSQTSQQDCAGAFTVCSATPFSGVSYGAGCSSDLTATPNNLGCLAGGERQGSWYAFATGVAGTLGLTITPSTPADLDWAVWGPFPQVGDPLSVGSNCVPSTVPKRCSNSSLLLTLNPASGPANPSASTGMGNASLLVNNPQYDTEVSVHNDGPLGATDGWVPGINVTPGDVYLLFVDDHHLSGASHTVSWNVSPANAIDCVLLPVDALVLKAEQRTSAVDLTWATNFEHGSSHFIVERSEDGMQYVPIGTVGAAGDSETRSEYLFVDERPLTGLNYYRLQLVDATGETDHSNVVTALFKADAVSILVVPNPARDRAELLLSTAYDAPLNGIVTDGSGRVVVTFRMAEGMMRTELPIVKLEAGSYTVQLLTDKRESYARSRFVKQ